jgi:queuine tRNA-ribosyltransferase
MTKFQFNLAKNKGKSRAGEMITEHGIINTPIFMPVGTAATIKSIDSQDIENLNAQIILSNTYHLYLRPGMEKLQQLGGLHKFMKWPKPILTDSGGFQVFSLGKQQTTKDGVSQVKISENQVAFKSHLDGSEHIFTPQKAIEIQRQIGADIIMAFDECTPDGETQQYTLQALERTHDWAEQCVKYWEKHDKLSVYGNYQALFGIIQGALFEEYRRQGAQFISNLPFDGIAVGGQTVGYNMTGTKMVMDWIEDSLPIDKPRYAMGLGRDPQDLIDAVLIGFDMFDCVGPTRLARNGSIYFGQLEFRDDKPVFASPYNRARLQIGNAQFATDQKVLQPGCDCYTCTEGYTRAYLNHLFKSKELSYYRFASIHNVRTMIRLTEQLREWILS